MPMDFRANVQPFRQDSCFRYFFGFDRPGLAGLVDADNHPCSFRPGETRRQRTRTGASAGMLLRSAHHRLNIDKA
jgi:hypothetical protein